MFLFLSTIQAEAIRAPSRRRILPIHSLFHHTRDLPQERPELTIVDPNHANLRDLDHIAFTTFAITVIGYLQLARRYIQTIIVVQAQLSA